MSVKRRLMVMAMCAGLVAGFAPVGSAPASASDCESDVQLFFWYGTQVDVSDAGLWNPTTTLPAPPVPPVPDEDDPTSWDPTTYDPTTYDPTTFDPTTGAPINTVTVSNPVAVYHALVGCIAGDATGTTVDLFYVPPGSLMVSGRDNAHACQEWAEGQASIVGLGVNYTGPWTKPQSAVTGECDAEIGTNGARTPTLAMDPTEPLGFITGTTPKGSITFRTIDN